MSLTNTDLNLIEGIVQRLLHANNQTVQKMIDNSNAEQMELVIKHFASKDELQEVKNELKLEIKNMRNDMTGFREEMWQFGHIQNTLIEELKEIKLTVNQNSIEIAVLKKP